MIVNVIHLDSRYSRDEDGATGTLSKAFPIMIGSWAFLSETQKTVECGMPRRSLDYNFEKLDLEEVITSFTHFNALKI